MNTKKSAWLAWLIWEIHKAIIKLRSISWCVSPIIVSVNWWSFWGAEKSPVFLLGGFSPPEKYARVRWDDEIPNIWKFIKAMFQTTNQFWCVFWKCRSPPIAPALFVRENPRLTPVDWWLNVAKWAMPSTSQTGQNHGPNIPKISRGYVDVSVE